MYELISETEPVARKDYRCIWCPELIRKGEKHIHEVSKWEGEFQNHRWHPECQKAADGYFRKCGESEFDPNTFKRGTSEDV